MSHFPPQTNGPASAQRLSFYTDNKTAMPPLPPASLGDNTTIEADVADTYATGGGNYYTGNGIGNGNGNGGGGHYYTTNGNVNGGGGGGHTEYPYSPSDVQRPRISPAPGMLRPPPPPSTVGDDDTMSVANGAPPTSRYHPSAGWLHNIDEAAAVSGSGQPYRPHAWADGEKNGALAAAGATAAVSQPPQPPKTGKRKMLGRLIKKGRREPEHQAPIAPFTNRSVGGGGGGGGGGAASGSTAPAAPDQPPGRPAQGQEKPAALRIHVTAADIREAIDLLRQLYRMELQIHDDRFVVDDSTSALKELRASCDRADRLCEEIERRVQQWADTLGSSWDPSEKEHVDFSVRNIKALWDLGKSSRRRLQERS